MRRSFKHVVPWCGLLTLLAVGTGCQRGPGFRLVPVEGTVTKAGVPLEGIEVTFRADVEAGTQGPRARGFTDEAGHYRLHNDSGGDGAVPGKHRVCVLDRTANPETAAEDRRVPAGYERFDQTPLRAEVGREPLVFDIPVP